MSAVKLAREEGTQLPSAVAIIWPWFVSLKFLRRIVVVG